MLKLRSKVQQSKIQKRDTIKWLTIFHHLILCILLWVYYMFSLKLSIRLPARTGVTYPVQAKSASYRQNQPSVYYKYTVQPWTKPTYYIQNQPITYKKRRFPRQIATITVRGIHGHYVPLVVYIFEKLRNSVIKEQIGKKMKRGKSVFTPLDQQFSRQR